MYITWSWNWVPSCTEGITVSPPRLPQVFDSSLEGLTELRKAISYSLLQQKDMDSSQPREKVQRVKSRRDQENGPQQEQVTR